MSEPKANKMKYVRINDRICCVSAKEAEQLSITYSIADTIEELCDERVFIRTYDYMEYVYHEIVDERKWDTLAKVVSVGLSKGYTDCNVYGAIWTDKGLIFVAKLNKNGRLELI